MSRPRAATSVATRISDRAVAEAAQHAVALLLREAAVQRLGAVAAPAQRLGQLVDLDPRSAEDDRRGRRFHVEHARQRGRLVAALHDVGHLAHARRFALGDGLGGDRHPHRVAQVALGDLEDAARHRGREERRLALAGHGGENRFQLVGEAHVEHLVGLVEHDRLDGVEIERAAAEVVQRAAGRRDDDVHAALERAQLLAHRLAAVDRQHPDAQAAPVAVHRLGDLHRQLAGRHQDQAADRAPLAARAADAVQQRQREGGRLAGAGRGLAQHVAPGQQRRDRLALDRGRLLVAQRRQLGDQRGIDAQRGKAVAARFGRVHHARLLR